MCGGNTISVYVCEPGLVARLTNVVESEFAQITYTEAVALLQKEIKDKKVCMLCMYVCMYVMKVFG
jgi:sulfur transfer complex TusBCD TusB component (DsrH family)